MSINKSLNPSDKSLNNSLSSPNKSIRTQEIGRWYEAAKITPELWQCEGNHGGIAWFSDDVVVKYGENELVTEAFMAKEEADPEPYWMDAYEWQPIKDVTHWAKVA